MEKLTSLIKIVLVLIFAFPFLATAIVAKPLMPLGFSDYSIEIPDDVPLPAYFFRLERTQTTFHRAADGSLVEFESYRDPEFLYLKDGKEFLPYTEMVKWEENTENPLHVIGIIFVNDNNEIEVYTDRQGLEGSATDKLEKVIGVELGTVLVTKIPRKNGG